MSLDLEARLRTFFASAPQTVHPIRTVEIRHSAMSRVYYLWREPYAGQITTDDGVVDVAPANIDVRLAGSEGHLDQRYTLSIGLFDEDGSANAFRDEIDRIPLDTDVKIVVIYREYLSDDLTAAQATAVLQVESVAWVKGAATITAVAPRLNMTRTGELYAPRDIPMLRGFL